jgi:hypothetical protein
LGLVMASFWPTSRLRSVDLPTLGFPTTATNPERDTYWRWEMGCGRNLFVTRFALGNQLRITSEDELPQEEF